MLPIDGPPQEPPNPSPCTLITSVLPLGIDLLISPPLIALMSCAVNSRTSFLPPLTIVFMLAFLFSLHVVQRANHPPLSFDPRSGSRRLQTVPAKDSLLEGPRLFKAGPEHFVQFAKC